MLQYIAYASVVATALVVFFLLLLVAQCPHAYLCVNGHVCIPTGKLKRQHKKEMKGAIRELRKDAKFIANTKLQEKRQFDAER